MSNQTNQTSQVSNGKTNHHVDAIKTDSVARKASGSGQDETAQAGKAGSDVGNGHVDWTHEFDAFKAQAEQLGERAAVYFDKAGERLAPAVRWAKGHPFILVGSAAFVILLAGGLIYRRK